VTPGFVFLHGSSFAAGADLSLRHPALVQMFFADPPVARLVVDEHGHAGSFTSSAPR
jgi:hypothetical protein